MLNSEYLSNLNKNQKEAVEYLDGPLLINGKIKVFILKMLF